MTAEPQNWDNGIESTGGIALGWGKKEITHSGFLEGIFPKKSETTSSTGYFMARDPRVDKIRAEVKALNDKLETIKNEIPRVANATISSLPTEKYELITPLNVIIKIYNDEAIAIYPELELYGEGANEIEALNELKNEFIDLIDDLNDIPEKKLGNTPKTWKKTLNNLIKTCQ